MTQRLSKKTQERLAKLIEQACLLGHAKNDFDLYKAAQSIVLLDWDYCITLPSLGRAKEILAGFQKHSTQEA